MYVYKEFYKHFSESHIRVALALWEIFYWYFDKYHTI